MNVYIDQVDDGLGSADLWDDIIKPADAWGNSGATQPSETAASQGSTVQAKSAR